MDYAEFIATWGYPAILLGAMAEGETVLLLGGIAAGAGILSWPGVVLSGWVGAFSVVQTWFFIGHFGGERMLASRPQLEPGVRRVREVLAERGWLLYVGYRLLFGLRSFTPFTLGASGVRPSVFVTVDAISWLAWYTLISGVGYAFGDAALPWLETLFASQQYLVVAVLLGLTAWGVRYALRTRTATPET